MTLSLRLAKKVGAPEDQHRSPKPFLVERLLILVADKPLTLVQQFCDLEFTGQRALAPALRSDGR